MCGRYTNTATSTGAIRERFDLAEEVPAEGLGRANVSPTQQVLAVVRDRDEEPRPVMLRWAWRRGGRRSRAARRSSTPATTRSRPPTPGSRSCAPRLTAR
jgi:putative SOS response-associated peptidase YedK